MGMSAYFATIREKVGAELLLIPSVSVLPWDSDGRLLLVRHSPSGPWDLLAEQWSRTKHLKKLLEESVRGSGGGVEVTGLRTVLGGPSYA